LPAASAGFPRVVVDGLGNRVSIASRPRRIVSLAPNVTEDLFALRLADRVVARTASCDYPPAAARLPTIGGYTTSSLERILSFDPDLVVGSRGNTMLLLRALTNAGVPVIAVEPTENLAAIYASLRLVGRATGADRAAEDLVRQMEARVKAAAARTSTLPEAKRPRVFLLVDEPFWTAGRGTFQDEAIRLAGGRNIAENVRGFGELNKETLFTNEPDVVVAYRSGKAPHAFGGELSTRPVLRDLRAVRQNHVIYVGDAFMRPGPRLAEAIEDLARRLHPELNWPALAR
jgi:iron complex transport system substrate-binding protein